MKKQRTISEAAAEILKASASGAPAQSRQHLEGDGSGLGTGQDLGGDTPDHVESENPDGVTGSKAKEPGPRPKVGSDPKKGLRSNNNGLDIDKQKDGTNKEDGNLTHVKQKSNESVDLDDDNDQDETEDLGGDEQVDDNDDELTEEDESSVILFDREAIYESFKEELDSDLGTLLDGDESLTEEFKNKIRTVFEAAVMSRVDVMADALESAFVDTLSEAIEEIKTDLTEKTNDYLSYVAEEWLKENELAIEKGLRTELTEDFIAGLKQLFEEHYIEIPEEKVNVVEELSDELTSAEERLNEEIGKNFELVKAIKQYQAAGVFATVCEGLTDVQVDKLQSLAEGLEFTTEDEFEEKLRILKDNYFTVGSGEKKAETKTDGGLNEAVEIEDDATNKSAKTHDPAVAGMMHALGRASQK
jgi:hypothetical protein